MGVTEDILAFVTQQVDAVDKDPLDSLVDGDPVADGLLLEQFVLPEVDKRLLRGIKDAIGDVDSQLRHDREAIREKAAIGIRGFKSSLAEALRLKGMARNATQPIIRDIIEALVDVFRQRLEDEEESINMLNGVVKSYADGMRDVVGRFNEFVRDLKMGRI